jgi:hypothetical protein
VRDALLSTNTNINTDDLRDAVDVPSSIEIVPLSRLESTCEEDVLIPFLLRLSLSLSFLLLEDRQAGANDSPPS